MFRGHWLDLSVISSCSGLGIIIGSWFFFGKLNISEIVNILLSDGIDSHTYVSHPVVIARRHGRRTFIEKSIIGVHVHESISKSNRLSSSWITFIVKLKIIKEVINGLFTFFSAENSCRVFNWEHNTCKSVFNRISRCFHCPYSLNSDFHVVSCSSNQVLRWWMDS
jgi:hypothetical protein